MDSPFTTEKDLEQSKKDPLLNNIPKIPSKLKIFSQTLSRHIESMKIDPSRNCDYLLSCLRELVKGEIWEIPKFFLPKECDGLIQETEEMGYEDATKMAGANSEVILRNMKRLFLSDMQTSEILTSKLRNLVPLSYEGGLFQGVNENFKFYKYEKGNKYDKHIDGEFENETLQTKSVASFIIYLNEPKRGGFTKFHSHKFTNGTLDVKPERGKILIYRQKGWMHQGLPVESDDEKYILRGDLMYRWLDNKEIDTLKNIKCGLCKTEIKVMDLFSCEHKLVSCQCIQFHDEISEITQNPKLGQCKWCKKKYQLENNNFFNFFDDKSKCQIY